MRYLGGALKRVPVDGDGVVRQLLDAARQPDAVLRVCNKTTRHINLVQRCSTRNDAADFD